MLLHPALLESVAVQGVVAVTPPSPPRPKGPAVEQETRGQGLEQGRRRRALEQGMGGLGIKEHVDVCTLW